MILLLVVGLAGFGLASSAFPGSIEWMSVDAGLQKAKSARKYALADVYTDWCGWCKKLDSDTFSNASLENFLNEKFVCIKANAEDNGQGQRLASEYRVNGFPCALVFDQSGKFIGRISGYRDAAAYEDALNHLIANPNP
jgi:thioredoxin-related protein